MDIGNELFNIGAIGIFALLVIEKLIALIAKSKNGNGTAKQDHSVHISLDRQNQNIENVIQRIEELDRKVDSLPCERFQRSKCPNDNDQDKADM